MRSHRIPPIPGLILKKSSRPNEAHVSADVAGALIAGSPGGLRQDESGLAMDGMGKECGRAACCIIKVQDQTQTDAQ